MALSGTLGAMLQGVSQQPSYLRADGQVTEQINFIPDVTRGLTTRPAAEVQESFTATADLAWLNVQLKGEQIALGLDTGSLIARKSDGTHIPVTGGTNAYIGKNARAYVYDDEIYVLNRDQVVYMDSSTILPTTEGTATVVVDSQTYSRNYVYVTALGGRFSNTYTVRLTYSDGAVAVGTYTTPDGSTAGDADKVVASYILDQLRISVTGHGSYKGTSSYSLEDSTIWFTDSAFDVTITGDDGDNGASLRFCDEFTETIADMPKIAYQGSIIRVTGEAGGADNVWFRFTGSSFGSTGVWVETVDPQAENDMDLTSMPHVLSGDVGGLTLAQGNWQGRRTGDTDTNPVPSFIGVALRDISGFQSRLVVVADKNVVMSRTNIPVDFWRSSAANRIDTDRIDIISTTESDYSLEWVLPFDRDLVIFGLKSQFLITGEAALTPDNAGIVETTNFETSGDTRPVSTGRTILFPFQEGGFAGVKEFYSANSVDANEAISITKVQSRYMPGNMVRMESSTNFSLMICQTDDDPTKLFGYQYYFDGESKVQSSWYTIQLPYAVRNFSFGGSTLNVLLGDGTDHWQTAMDFDLPANPDTGYHISMDMLKEHTPTDYTYNGDADNYTSVVSEFEDRIFVQGAGCDTPGRSLAYTAVIPDASNWRYIFAKDVAPSGSTVFAGENFSASVEPTMPLFRDREGKPISNSKLVVNAFVLYFEDSGFIDATMASKYRTNDVTHTNRAFPIVGDPNDPTGIGLKSGEFRVRWGERSDWSTLTISTDDIRPLTITEVEWEGQVLTRGRRI